VRHDFTRQTMAPPGLVARSIRLWGATPARPQLYLLARVPDAGGAIPV